MQPLLFQDDIVRLSTTVESAQSGNNRVESVMECKLLDLNLDKSGVLVLGPTKRQKEILDKLKENPLTLKNQPMNIFDCEKYLGDYISSKGLAHGILVTIKRRKPKVIQYLLETKTVMEDCKANSLGGLEAGLNIWEIAILPFLINNCETWVDISSESVKMLDDIQLLFLRQLFGTPRTCPSPALLWESGSTMMVHRIARRKLMFYHHLINLPENTLAFEVAQVQEILGYPGLVQEAKLLIERYGLPNPQPFTKNQWKTLTKKAISNENQKDLLEKIRSYKKLDYSKLSLEKFGTQEYIKKLNIPDARLKFALRSKMTRTVQMNFKSEKRFILNGWKCVSCGNLDTQEHLLSCPGYSFLRDGKKLDQDQDLVIYIRNIIKHRLEDGLS